MIGAELLNLMYGNPYNQFAGAMNPAPNPNPNAPPRSLPPQTTMATPAEQRGAQVGPMPPGGPQTPTGGPQPQGAPNAPPPPPPGQQGLPPTAATQSPPDLASLYLQMEQRNRSANEIDHGLDMMAAAFSTPQMASAIMGSSRGQGQDPGAQLGNLIMLQNMQRMNAIPAPAGFPDANTWAALPPEAKAKYIEAQGGANIDIAKQGAETRQKDLLEAQQQSPKMTPLLSQMDTLAGQIQGATNPDGSPALQGIMSSAVKRAAAQRVLETDPDKESIGGAVLDQMAAAQFTPQEQAALQKMKTLNAQVYGEAFQSTGSRRTGQEVKNLQTGLTPLKNFNQPYADYMTQFGQFTDQLHKSIANNYGAAQDLDSIPEQYRWAADGTPNVAHDYLPGGNLYEGKGGAWVNNPPKKGGSFNYDAIPSGTVYTAPDGTQRRKP